MQQVSLELKPQYSWVVQWQSENDLTPLAQGFDSKDKAMQVANEMMSQRPSLVYISVTRRNA